ncbi:MAG: hypothetical protein DHS20C11_01980 [Lysobacteraceae bacterium]|nr:MAG: hypothetical protein DHS20C11_01980 [Xanthomonadaceae bacterium]
MMSQQEAHVAIVRMWLDQPKEKQTEANIVRFALRTAGSVPFKYDGDHFVIIKQWIKDAMDHKLTDP